MAQLDPNRLFSVEGMVVVITGGATGIGLMMTKAFALNGASKVYIVGRRKEKLDEAAKISPSNIIPLVGDVTSKESLSHVAEQVKRDVGYVNLLICNSGTMAKTIVADPSQVSVQEYAKAALDQDFDDWTHVFATNTVSVTFTAFAFLELLDAGNKKDNATRRRSQILVTSSIAGYIRSGVSNLAYGASKAAVTHLIKQLSSTLMPYHIRVNGVAPGLFPSELAAGLIANLSAKPDDLGEEGACDRSFVPATRLGRNEDIAGLVLYHASEAGSYLNGNITVVDGGRLGILPSSY